MTISRRTFLGAAATALTPGLLKGQDHSHLESSREEIRPFPSLPKPGQDPHRFDPWVEVVPKNLSHNVREVRRLSGNRPILAVVKNNAYGLDLRTVGGLLEKEPGIVGFAAVKGEEAMELRKAGVEKPILLMGMFSEEEGRELAEAGVLLSAFTEDAGERIAPLARSLGRPVDVHLYLDSGMGRMGMPFREAGPWIEALAETPEVRIAGAFTELGEDRAFDPEQLRRFLEILEGARRSGIELGDIHAAASNGVFHFPGGHLDIVRPGIALFGSYPSEPDTERGMAELRSAFRFRARVVRVSHLEPGDGVGYGRPWRAQAPTWVATLPVGHADGYPREAVTGAKVLIGDRLFPVIGAVSASHCIVHVGDEALVGVGDVATLMGPDDPALEPNSLAGALGVSVYDLLMHMNPLLPRILVEE